MVRWRRLCVDVDERDQVIGGSAELYDDSHRDANAVVVLAPSELDGHSVATLSEYLRAQVRWEQYQLDLEPY